MTAKPLQIGLAGLGTVGTGVYETLCRNHELLEARVQMSFEVKRVAVRDLGRPRDVAIDPALLTDDWRTLVEDPDIDIIIELIGGVTDAYELITAALRAHKPVVTGNKALLAERGGELFRLSAETETPLYFEASCGGGIPIIQSLTASLICNNVERIAGIINGTSNYILSAMERKGVSYEEALSAARRKGYAEADPSLDVNGRDAAHKALILAMLAYGTPVDPRAIAVYGIERVTSVDFQFAHRLGYTIKLLVVIKHHEDSGKLELRVQPSFVPKEHLLANVNGVFNAIAVRGDIVGETIFYGRGAGKNPTASAVIGDVMLAMRDCRHPEHHSGFHPYTQAPELMPAEETVTPYYVRFLVQDRPGVIAAIAAELAKKGIGISAITSTPHGEEEQADSNDLVLLLHACAWGKLKQALREIGNYDSIDRHPVVFRIENFNES